MAEKELVRDSNSANVSRCEVRKDFEKSKALEDETLRYRRCDRNNSEGNEAIFDCTGGKTLGVKVRDLLQIPSIDTKKNSVRGSFFCCLQNLKIKQKIFLRKLYVNVVRTL